MRRVTTIAGNALLELIRQKVFYFMLLFAAIAIGVAFVVSGMPFGEQFQVLKDASLGAMSIFSFLLVTLATAMILPKDIEDRTLYTVLAKPVSRLQYLLGKLFGVLTLLFVALFLMSALFFLALYAREQLVIAATLKDLGPGPDGEAAVAAVKAAAFNWNLVLAILVIFTKSAVCASLTLMLSTFASSWIFTVMVSVVIYIIGHIQPIAREAWLAEREAKIEVVSSSSLKPLKKTFLGVTSLVFPDFQLFNIVDEIVVGNAVPPRMFGQVFALGLGYVVIYSLVGFIFFAHREL